MNESHTVSSRDRRAQRGFTMIELLITMTVAAVLAGLAVPAMSSFVHNDRDIGQINSLVASFNYARSEAIKRASPTGISVCPSTDGVACGGTNWAGGWIVLDNNPLDPLPHVLQAVPAMQGSNTLTPVFAGATGITFSSTGSVSALLTIRVCDTRGAAYARDVEVIQTGRVSASQTPGQTVNGSALVCP